jgi:uncharacterized protein (TIGR03437 family)
LNVGFRIVSIGSLKTGVWYPSAAPEAPYPYSNRISGSIALNAAPATCGTFPLVVFSHGFGGCGTQSVFLTEQFARTGAVVAAPDHADATCSVDGGTGALPDTAQTPFTNPSAWTPQTYIDRRNDMQNTISGMLASAIFGAIIDPARIGGMGHSLGGYTILGLAGAWQSWRDPRIKAALLLSPYADPFVVSNTLSGVAVPVMYQGGTLDFGVTPSLNRNQGAYDTTPPSKFFVEFPGATHFAWTNAACTSAGTVAQCLSSAPNAASINNYSFSFLRHYLSGENTALLWSEPVGLADYRRLSALSAASTASYRAGAALAPESIASIFSEGMAQQAVSAPDPFNLPGSRFNPGDGSLGGVRVSVTDAGNTTRPALLYYVSPGQINFVMPLEANPGRATLTVFNGTKAVAQGVVQIETVAPGLFSAAGTGQGPAAGQALIVTAAGTQMFASLSQPVDLTAGSVYLVLYGTGMRGQPVKAAVGGIDVPVLYLVAQGQYAGMDQVALGPLPKTLAGSGTGSIVITVASKAANPVTAIFP